MNTIRVFEYETLSMFGNEENRKLSEDQLNRLLKFNDKNNNLYFVPVHGGIKFTSYVGVIQIGGLTIEILPKAGRKKEGENNEYEKWQKVLLNMLSVCKFMNVSSVSETYLHKRYNSLLEMYFEIFLDEVIMLLRKGLIKKYRKHSGNLFALKGKLQFSKHIQKNLIHAERFYTEHQEYDHEHLINQILLRALILLKKLHLQSHLQDKINRIFLDFPEINQLEINSLHFQRLKETRKTLAYNRALQISKMIILNYSPDIRGGSDHMIALLFDMNKLWEQYIYQMLLRENDPEMKIHYNTSQKFWENKSIRPDIVITKNEKTFIIDTKWKIINPGDPADDDLRQMFAYNVFWDAQKSILLYPETEVCEEKFGTFHKGIYGKNQCKAAFVNIFKDQEKGELDFTIGKKILQKFNEN